MWKTSCYIEVTLHVYSKCRTTINFRWTWARWAINYIFDTNSCCKPDRRHMCILCWNSLAFPPWRQPDENVRMSKLSDGSKPTESRFFNYRQGIKKKREWNSGTWGWIIKNKIETYAWCRPLVSSSNKSTITIWTWLRKPCNVLAQAFNHSFSKKAIINS